MKSKALLFSALLALGWGLQAQNDAPINPALTEEENVECTTPTNLRSTFTDNNEHYSITFNWAPQGDESRWDIVITTDSIGGFNVNIDATVNTPQYTINSHTVGLNYMVKVRARCSETSQSEWETLAYQEPHWVDIVDADKVASLTIYPNPAHESTTIDLTDMNDLTKIDLCDASGKRVRSWHIDGGKATQLDLHGLAQGWYMMTIENRHQIINKKLIVQ